MIDDLGTNVERPAGLPDRYEILGLLGIGGMGRVLLARDQVLDRKVAVKVLADHCADNESYAERFLKEARSAAQLNHPNIVQIYEFGKQDGCVFLVMEYVDGISLKSDMSKNGRFSERRAAELIGDACQALGAAHGRGIMHRDVKPDNMMLSNAGVFKLVDLGLAKQLDEAIDQTVTGSTMGTPHYISPEQILGDKVVDCRTDIYSLGASLYFLATGCVPFVGSSGAHIMSRHLNDPLPDPRSLVPNLSPVFCRTVHKAMAKEPAQRHQDTRELMADLEAVRAMAPVEPDHINVEPSDLTVAIIQTPSGAAFCPTFETPFELDDLHHLEEELAKAIGPMARVLVGRESRLAMARPVLVESLASHISDRRERRRFLKAVGRGDTGSGSLSNTGFRSGAGSFARPASVLEPEIVEAVTRHLADQMGPVARVLVNRETQAGGGFGAVVERLATHLNEESERQAFLQAVAHLG
jgi:serine/threonine protein kinase